MCNEKQEATLCTLRESICTVTGADGNTTVNVFFDEAKVRCVGSEKAEKSIRLKAGEFRASASLVMNYQ
ncbi:hypothetical protein [Xenorhabdus bovienii]|uniref:Uncharacterized protein n=1 Tax=Xenorhabdus bovienii str. Intermedium TaxID=1379677 RepID=A0A077QHM4_XENBV|nr:hypothetical protein [Xenorhabdus bovienii]MDE9483334.1 hypothetical protein [Xenorhabdus bovienii]CDH33009.1 hypothetical protein XBI1_2300010 [Xenorhabdus bovienii str. Intermedium]